MRHHNSVFHGVLKAVPWDVFDRLVEEHEADWRVRRLSTKSQFVALLYGQLEGAVSLREIAAGLESHQSRLYHLGAAPARRSTLADANALRPCALFAELFAAMMARAHRPLRRKLAETTYLIDSTGLRLDGQPRLGALLGQGVRRQVARRLRRRWRPPDLCRDHRGTGQRRHRAAQAMPIEPGATYVFDLGYYDYAWWARLDQEGCRIVTRFKRNTPLAVIEELAVAADSAILSDRIGFLPYRQGAGRRNPMRHAVREIQVKTETGKVLRILSNDLDAPAPQIAELYKRRWAIELFFRWVKQTLRITRFLGTSENAVKIQIAVALIAFLLLRLAQAAQKAVISPLHFARLVRANLMHRKPLDRLLKPEPTPLRNPAQLAIQWNLG